jgi:hypothetical protein
LNHNIYATSGVQKVQKEAPATFDELSALAVSQGIKFTNKHYRQARRWQVQSGNHNKPFDAYCANRPYLLLYHNNLLECGDQVPKLPDSVKRSLMDKKTESQENAVPSTAEKKKRSSAVIWKNFWWPAMNVHANSTLNTKGKNQQVYKDALQLYGDIRECLSRERHTMGALKAKPGRIR